MTDVPLVSINVPTYNHENYLSECLDSLINQTYKNLEIIVVEDCSTDRTLEIAREYQLKYPEIIKLLHNEENLGVCKTWLRGYRIAKGDYFATFAGDDIMLPEKIELQVKALEENPDCPLCVTNGYWFESETGKILKDYGSKKLKHTFRKMMRRQCVFAPSTLARRSALPPSDIFEGLLSTEWIYFAEILKHGDSVYLPQPLVKYRITGNSLSKNLDYVFATDFEALNYFLKNMSPPPDIYRGYAQLHKRYARYLNKSKKDYSNARKHYRLSLLNRMIYFRKLLLKF